MGDSAIISPCGVYRYRLERQCDGDGATAIIMVNPSTADAEKDDATIRKLRGFGDRHKWGRLIVGNLFAYRATDVRALSKTMAIDPVGGPEADKHLSNIFHEADRVVVAWGPLAKQPRYHRGRWREVIALIAAGTPILSIGDPAKDGHPKHPLMLPYASLIQPWRQPC